MIARYRAVQRLPQPLNHVDPRVMDELKEQLELRVVRQAPPERSRPGRRGMIPSTFGALADEQIAALGAPIAGALVAVRLR